MAQYREGTVTVTQGSTTVTGSGVDWSGVTTDWIFSIDDPSAPLYFITSVHAGDNPPWLQLAATYQDISAIDIAYGLSRDFTPNNKYPLIYGEDVNTRALLRLFATRADTATGGGGGPGGGVSTVFGRPGPNIVAQAGDYNAGQITETTTAKIMTSTERTKLGTIAQDAQVNRLQSTSAQAILGVDLTTDMSPVRVREAINSWLRGGVGVSGTVTLNAGTDPATSHFGKFIRADNSVAAVRVILPSATSATCPDGFFCYVSGGSNSFDLSIELTVAGQLRTQPGVTGWNTLSNVIYQGYKTASIAQSLMAIYKYSGTWVAVGPMRALAGDDTTPGVGSTSGFVLQDETNPPFTARTSMQVVGAGATVTDDGAKYVLTIPGGAVTSFSTVTGDPYDNTALTSALNAKANVADAAEAVNGGNLVPVSGTISIAIPRRQTRYNTYTQAGVINFALNVAGSSYNLGEAVFYFVATEDPANIGHSYGITWNPNLVFATSGMNADLPSTMAPGSVLIVVVFDEVNARGLVYFAGGAIGGGTGTDPDALPLAGGTMTGPLVLGTGASIDGGGNFISNHIRRILNPDAVSGLLSTTQHSGNIVISGGQIEIPNVQGFFCEIIMGGAHSIKFGLNETQPLAVNDWVTVVVTNPGYMHAKIAYAVDQPLFLPPAPTVIGGYSTIFNLGSSVHQQTASYTLPAGTTLLCVSVHANVTQSSTLEWRPPGYPGVAAQPMTQALNPGDYTGTQAVLYYLYNPTGAGGAAGSIVWTLGGSTTAPVVLNAYPVRNAAIGATPLTVTQPMYSGGANPSNLHLTVPNNTLVFHVITQAVSYGVAVSAWGNDEVADCDESCASNFRAQASHKYVSIGGDTSVSVVLIGTASRYVDTMVAFSGV